MEIPRGDSGRSVAVGALGWWFRMPTGGGFRVACGGGVIAAGSGRARQADRAGTLASEKIDAQLGQRLRSAGESRTRTRRLV